MSAPPARERRRRKPASRRWGSWSQPDRQASPRPGPRREPGHRSDDALPCAATGKISIRGSDPRRRRAGQAVSRSEEPAWPRLEPRMHHAVRMPLSRPRKRAADETVVLAAVRRSVAVPSRSDPTSTFASWRATGRSIARRRRVGRCAPLSALGCRPLRRSSSRRLRGRRCSNSRRTILATRDLLARPSASGRAMRRSLERRSRIARTPGLFSEGELARFAARLEEEAAARHARSGEFALSPRARGESLEREAFVTSTSRGGLLRARSPHERFAAEGWRPWAELVRLGVLVPREARRDRERRRVPLARA